MNPGVTTPPTAPGAGESRDGDLQKVFGYSHVKTLVNPEMFTATDTRDSVPSLQPSHQLSVTLQTCGQVHCASRWVVLTS